VNRPPLWYRSGCLAAFRGNIHGFLGKQAFLPKPDVLWNGARRLVWMEQVHGDAIQVVTQAMLTGKESFHSGSPDGWADYEPSRSSACCPYRGLCPAACH